MFVDTGEQDGLILMELIKKQKLAVASDSQCLRDLFMYACGSSSDSFENLGATKKLIETIENKKKNKEIYHESHSCCIMISKDIMQKYTVQM